MPDELDPKLLKVIALAKHGVGGEKENAIKVVKKICAENDLNFDDVMFATDERQYKLTYKTDAELSVLAQVVYAFCELPDGSISYNKYFKEMFFTTTPGKFIDVKNAADIYLKAFRAERRKLLKSLPDAFIVKHQLWGKPSDNKQQKEWTDEERKNAQNAIHLAGNLDDVDIHKRIGNGDEN